MNREFLTIDSRHLQSRHLECSSESSANSDVSCKPASRRFEPHSTESEKFSNEGYDSIGCKTILESNIVFKVYTE